MAVRRKPLLPPSDPWSTRQIGSKNKADEKMEEIQDLCEPPEIQLDLFEMALEETEKKTVYARDDRAAVREALSQLQTTYTNAVQQSEPSISSEIRSRVGDRIRELEAAVTELNKADLEEA
ncbi:MAG: hypothetical protein M1825_006394 [Sarcosagium campestre]|nr:MAG: hypothetical protein M1825_006394 [Sarcosagium campestre]